MKVSATILLLNLLAVAFAYAQPVFHSDFERSAFESGDPLQILISSDSTITFSKYNEIKAELDRLIDRLQEKKKKWNDDERFVEWAFYYLHRKNLGWYKNYISFSEIFTHRNYDCLTGTAFYAIVFGRLGISCKIYEFDYHSLLVVEGGDQQMLIESTDALGGFVRDKADIDERLRYYAQEEDTSAGGPAGLGNGTQADRKNLAVHRTIDLVALAGLQYFNLAVNEFNNQNYEAANRYITKADLLYPSDRVKGVKKLIAGK